jgi:DNA (cytosine-5)-methyltransferase 1
MNPKSIPVVSLFSGCGAMDLGFEQHGFTPILAIDKDQAAVDTYNHNRKANVALRGDLSLLSGSDIITMLEKRSPGLRPRGVIGGPPCQSFSLSNVHKVARDPRNLLPFHYAEIVKAINQKYFIDFFVFENVTGLRSRRHKDHFQKIRQSLEEAGFTLFEEVLDARWFGVPQSRRRIFIVGINKSLYAYIDFAFPTESSEKTRTVRHAIAGLPQPAFFSRDLLSQDIPFHPNHWTMNPKSKKFTSKKNNGKNIGRSFRQLQWEKPSLTIAYGHREIYIHPSGRRRLSILESMRLQAVPDTYELKGNFTEQVTQISDAVPPPLASAVAQKLRVAIYDPIEEIQRRLLEWFSNNKREFPWRRTSNPYAVLLAEKLLQQTSVNDTVVDIYRQLLRRYPTVHALAHADVKHLEQLIHRLGFNYRAKEMKKLAQAIVSDHHGKIPGDLASLLKLPGVGDYIARAILCFAYGQPVPIVDTNVARLLFRLFGLTGKFPQNPARNRRLINLASNLIPEDEAKSYNLAVLDFCAAICTPSNPKCEICPLLNLCHDGRRQTSRPNVSIDSHTDTIG